MEETNSTPGTMSTPSKSTSNIDNQVGKMIFSYSEVMPYTSDIDIKANTENKNTSSIYPFAHPNKNYIVVWLDSNYERSHKIHENNIMEIQQVINSVRSFTNVNECINFVTQLKNEKVFMIVSDDLVGQIIHLIEDKPQLESIYVLSNNQSNRKSWTQQCNKIKGVFSQIINICSSLKNEIRRYDNYSMTVCNLSISDTLNRGLNELDQSFMYSQLLKEILIEIEHEDKKKEMEDLVVILRDQYADDNIQLKSIDQFKHTYNFHSPIYWYTKESFIYSTLNKALRTQDVNTIIKTGFFIQDLHRQIEELHLKRINSVPQTLYRGQVILNTEFEKMKNSKGSLLSFNNFLSTSTDRDVSLMFAEPDPRNTDTIGVLFEIEIDRSTSSTSFASLDEVSQFHSEKEVLFSMNAVYRIVDIVQIKDRLWDMKLTLTNDTDEQLKRVTDSFREEIGGGTAWHQLGYLMIILDEIEQAEKIYSKLLNVTPDDKKMERAALYNQFGIINDKKGDYKTALSFFQKTIDIEERLLSSNDPRLAITYNNIAEAHHIMEDYEAARSMHQKALDIRERCLPPNDPLLAATYNNIGGVYRSLGDYQKALLTYQKALQIGEICFAFKHPDLATIYDSLASIHALMGEYSQASSFYQKARDIKQKVLPPHHTSQLTSDNNIAMTYDAIGNQLDALLILTKILAIQEKSLVPNHRMLTVLNNNIGLVYLDMGNSPKALSHYEKALEIQEKSVCQNNPELATTYNNIGNVYQTMREFKEARSYYERALQIDEKCRPADHPELATTYNNLAGVYLEMNDPQALSFCQRALEIRKKCFTPNHSSFAPVYNHLGRYYQGKNDFLTGISYYEKALKIHEESSSLNYQEWSNILSNMGTTYYSMEDYSVALSFFQRTLEVETKSLGTGHPNSAYTHHHIAYALAGLQRYKEAFHHRKKAVDIATHALECDDPRLQFFQDQRDIFLLKVLCIMYKTTG